MARRTSSHILGWILLVCAGLAAPRPLAAADRWVSLGPDVSTVQALLVTPSGVAYAGTSERGVFRSANGGSQWNTLNPAPPVSYVLELAASPQDPREIYARTSTGLYRSQNGGPWNLVGPSGTYDAFAIAPSDPDVLYTISGPNLHVSRDRGRTWNPAGVRVSDVMVLKVDPRDPDVLYAGTLSGVYKSTNGGFTWTVGIGPGGERDPYSVLSLALDPRRSEVLYAGTGPVPQGGGMLWKSADGGKTWTVALAVRPIDPVVAVAIDPVQPRRIYAAIDRVYALKAPPAGEVWRSEDDGASWHRVLAAGPIISLAVDPANPRNVYAGFEQDGVRKSEDRGATWRLARRGLQALTVTGVAVDPHHPGSLWIAAPDLDPFFIRYPYLGDYAHPGLFHSSNGGKTWVPASQGIGFPRDAPRRVTVDPARPGRLWAFGRSNFFRSADGGASWQETASPGGANMAALAVDPSDSDRLYLAGSRREPCGPCEGLIEVPVVLKSVDGGESWTDLPGGFDLGQEGFSRVGMMFGLAIHPARPATVFASGSTGVFRSRDHGDRWTRLSAAPSQCGPLGAIVIDPLAPGTLYATHCDSSRPVFKSADNGAHWQPTSLRLSGGLASIHDLAPDPRRPRTLYAAGDGGVFLTQDGGATWHSLNTGLPANARVFTLAADPGGPDRLYAGVQGAGLFTLKR